jgi:hypothetical protein
MLSVATHFCRKLPVDEQPTQSVNNPPIGFKPREFLLGLGVAVVIVLAVAGSRWYFRARTVSAVSSCYANLKQLEGAKSTWALEHQKRVEDVPNLSNIIGPKAYIAVMPACPQGGTYTLGPVGQPPRCSIPEHTLTQ